MPETLMPRRIVRQICVAVALAGSFVRVGAAPPEGENCQLTGPPDAAGEVHSFTPGVGIIARVFPRLSALPTNYTGCQVLWTGQSRALLFLRDGRVEAKYPEPEVPLCKAGEKTENTGCEPRQRALAVSFPAGCWARAQGEGKLPRDCLVEFRRDFAILDTQVE